ncbi:MAG TPA: hypothetical protein VIG33_11645 [Pseudobdellovibrionaceae bacterium]|jgi:hypothetical protein
MRKFNANNAALYWGSEDEFTDTNEDILSLVPPELTPLLPGFLARRENEIVELSEFLRLRQFASIKSVGHKMKGTGLGYGFQIITDLGRGLEQAAQDQEIDNIHLLIAKLTVFCKELRARMAIDLSRK